MQLHWQELHLCHRAFNITIDMVLLWRMVQPHRWLPLVLLQSITGYLPPGVGGAGLYRPTSNHRGHSPHRYSPNTPHSRGNSPHNQSTSAAGPGASPQQQQHVVHVVVNPGETFTVCIGDQTQHIPGKRFWCLFSERNILDQVLEVLCQKLKLSGREWSPVLLQLSGPGNLSFSLSF